MTNQDHLGGGGLNKIRGSTWSKASPFERNIKSWFFKFLVSFTNNHLNKFLIGSEKHNNYHNDFAFLPCWKPTEELQNGGKFRLHYKANRRKKGNSNSKRKLHDIQVVFMLKMPHICSNINFKSVLFHTNIWIFS